MTKFSVQLGKAQLDGHILLCEIRRTFVDPVDSFHTIHVKFNFQAILTKQKKRLKLRMPNLPVLVEKGGMAVQDKGIPFGRAIARELTVEEIEMIGGGEDGGNTFAMTRCLRSIEYDCGDYMQVD